VRRGDGFAPYSEAGLVAGRVVRVDRAMCDLFTADGPVRADTALVTPPDPMQVVCTGDWVAVDPAGGDPRFVRTLLPRRTAFVRSTSSKRSEGQVLAANLDHVVICVSLAAELDLGRLARFLSLAWERDDDGQEDQDQQLVLSPERLAWLEELRSRTPARDPAKGSEALQTQPSRRSPCPGTRPQVVMGASARSRWFCRWRCSGCPRPGRVRR
jgi:hypothetical protein